MKLFAKIFCSVMVLISVLFGIVGYFLLKLSMKAGMEREIEFAIRQYQYDRFAVQARLLADGTIMGAAAGETQAAFAVFQDIAGELSAPAGFWNEAGESLYLDDELDSASLWNENSSPGKDSSFPQEDKTFSWKLSENAYQYKLVSSEQENYILVGSRLSEGLDFVTKTDITAAVRQQRTLQQYFEKAYLIFLGAGSFLVFALSVFLTNPMKRMARAADRIANGYYSERLEVPGTDEISEMAESFNQMADAVEEKIAALSLAAEQKEEFVANFAHELKTPLTSMIGYADMLYQKDIGREGVRRAAEHIWNEGMRLEELAYKLMDLTVLGRKDFILTEMNAEEVLGDIAEGIRPLLEKKGVAFQWNAETEYIRVEYDLLKTLLFNLVDNSIKADSRNLVLSGKKTEGAYWISVTDDGRGIPAEELSRITEAFYMVDKSRSRKQHGAGLGLSLAEKAAKAQGGTLVFESTVGEGTTVRLIMPREGVQDER